MATEDRNGCLHGEDDGKFVAKTDTDKKAYDSKDNFSELKKKVAKATMMTKQEWALWYKAVAENKNLVIGRKK
ncbi:MAG: hypothetical protein E7362_00740 [Clostridiales bacterium]|nr:hypothetical protein [Clostridiales bacterium]